MAYNQDRDKVLKVFEMPQENGNFFIVSIFSYDGGKPKLQFSRRFEKSDGTSSYKASGRMTIEEMKFVNSCMEQIVSVMEGVWDAFWIDENKLICGGSWIVQ